MATPNNPFSPPKARIQSAPSKSQANVLPKIGLGNILLGYLVSSLAGPIVRTFADNISVGLMRLFWNWIKPSGPHPSWYGYVIRWNVNWDIFFFYLVTMTIPTIVILINRGSTQYHRPGLLRRFALRGFLFGMFINVLLLSWSLVTGELFSSMFMYEWFILSRQPLTFETLGFLFAAILVMGQRGKQMKQGNHGFD